ncbi:cadherin-like domain-containing protein [Vibrio chagasii]|nr:cadherin-like domain-containing protein [Vibrio chagasii]
MLPTLILTIEVGYTFETWHLDHGGLVSMEWRFHAPGKPSYNGTVHFSYDVADEPGGVAAHTGANTALASVNDAAAVSDGVDTKISPKITTPVSVQGNYSYMLGHAEH